MRKQKRPHNNLNNNTSLEEVFSQYDAVTILGLLNSFENSEAWKVFKAYSRTVQRQYEVDALDRAAKVGEHVPTAFASGYAKCAEDMTRTFMDGLRQTALNLNPVVTNDRIEEPEPKTVHDL